MYQLMGGSSGPSHDVWVQLVQANGVRGQRVLKEIRGYHRLPTVAEAKEDFLRDFNIVDPERYEFIIQTSARCIVPREDERLKKYLSDLASDATILLREK